MNLKLKKIISVFVLMFFCLIQFNLHTSAESSTILIQLTIGSKTASVNGKPVTMDVPPMIINGRTLVPLRFISDAFGAIINYDSATRMISITAPDGLALKKQTEEDQKTIKTLEDEIANLKNSNTGGLQSETEPPIITCNNIQDNQVISKPINLDVKTTDQSPIAYVCVKIGNIVISENPKTYGTIQPSRLLSGNYNLQIEAWDAFGNHGVKNIPITIQNDVSSEPVVLKVEAKEMKNQVPGNGPPGGRPGEGDNPIQLISLFLTAANNSLSTLEITKIEVFDQNGNLFQPRSDGGIIDTFKRQAGLNHILLISTDTFSSSVAMSRLEEGKEIADLFKNWKVSITFFDSNMQKEITKTLTVS
jgi:hypothetical protein